MTFNIKLDVGPRSRYAAVNLSVLLGHAALITAIFLALLWTIYKLNLAALETTLREVDQRLHLDLATRLAPRVRDIPVENSRDIQEALRSMESEYPRIKAYFIDSVGHVLVAADREASELPRSEVAIRPIEKLLRKGEAVLPKLGDNPAKPSEPLPFSVARLEPSSNYLYLILNESSYYPAWRVDRSFRSLRELHTHLILAALFVIIILVWRVGWLTLSRARSSSGSRGSKESVTDGTAGLVTTVASITSTLQEKARLLGQHREERKFIVSKVSQEIHEPLSTITNLLREIDREELSKQGRQTVLEAVSGQVEHLINRIDTIFKIVKYDSLHETIERDCIHAYECIQDAAQHFESVAEEKGIVIVYEIPLTAVVVWGDTELIHEAYSYLVREAIARAAVGSELRLGARVDGKEVLFDVSFTPSSPNVSYSFERPGSLPTDEGRDRLFGLYIARRIAEAHGGRVGVAESEGRASISLWFNKGRGEEHE